MGAMQYLYEQLRLVWSFDEPISAATANGLRIGTLIFVLGFLVASTLSVLFDRSDSHEMDSAWSDEQASASVDSRQRAEVLFLCAFLLLVLLFPFAFRSGLHAWLIAGGVVLGGIASKWTAEHGLELRRPGPLSAFERFILLGLCAVVVLLTFWEWREVPVVLGQDEAMIATTGLSVWRDSRHPFFLSSVAIPAVHPSISGFFLSLTNDPRFGLTLYPAICAALCPILMFGWCRLLGPHAFAWLATILFVTTPFFGYYARVPNGSSLIFMQLAALYGITRCLVAPGAIGPLLGGLALGIAHWDYPASRMLLLYSATLGVVLLPWSRQMARGWWLRLGILGLTAAPLVFAFPLISGYPAQQWTPYMTHPGYRVESSDVFKEPGALRERVGAHLRMAFDASGNASGPITIPGSPVKPWPMGALLLLGLGTVVFEFKRAPAPLIVWGLAVGMIGGLLSSGPPNGHRIMTAEAPAAALMAAGLHLLWPRSQQARSAIWAWIRRITCVGLLIWAGWAGLKYFHGDMWRGRGPITDQIFHQADRGLRVRDDIDTYDVRIVSGPLVWEELYLGPRVAELQRLHAGNWLPPNWSTRPTAGQADLAGEDLIGLVRSVFPPGAWKEVIDPAGFQAGWGYHTDSISLGAEEAARQWADEKHVDGSLMIPESGTLAIRCPGVEIGLHTALGSHSAPGTDILPVPVGLMRLVLTPLHAGEPLPRQIEVNLTPDKGTAERHTLRPDQLYRIPIHGWLETRLAQSNDNLGQPAIRQRLLPTLSEGLAAGDAAPSSDQLVRTILTARLRLPPGQYVVHLFPGRSHMVRLRVGERTLAAWTSPYDRPEQELVLDAATDDNLPVTILKEEDEGIDSVSLEVDGRHGFEVPPYDWFTPENPDHALSDLPIDVRGGD